MSDLLVNVCSKARSHNEVDLIKYTLKNMILETSSEISSRPGLDKKHTFKKKSHFSPCELINASSEKIKYKLIRVINKSLYFTEFKKFFP